MGMAEAAASPAGWPRRTQAARKRLEDASLRLFAEQGFERTTVDDLAAASGVGRRTIFRYFPSKNDIVFGALDERLNVLAAELDVGRARGLPLFDMLRRAFHVTNSYAPHERASLALRIQLIATVPSLQAHAALRNRAWEDTVRAAVAACTGAHGGVHARACAKAVVAVMWAAFDTWRETGAGDDLGQIIDAALSVLSSGLAATPAVAIQAATTQGASRPAAPPPSGSGPDA
jgi:AcrR family transcriptional regulator